MTNPQHLVEEFHTVYHVPVGNLSAPAVIRERVGLRIKLLLEEVEEVLEEVTDAELGDITLGYDPRVLNHIDIAKLSKELADLVYVVYGWAVEMGVDLGAVLQEVHFSNLSKLDNDGLPVFREDGKVLKGENYFEADVASVIAQQGQLPTIATWGC